MYRNNGVTVAYVDGDEENEEVLGVRDGIPQLQLGHCRCQRPTPVREMASTMQCTRTPPLGTAAAPSCKSQLASQTVRPFPSPSHLTGPVGMSSLFRNANKST